MLSTPFHIRLLHDDVVSNIVSFSDKRTVLSVALSCRQLYAVYKSGELDNPMLYRTQLELQPIVDLSGDFTKDSFLRLNADQLQQVLKKRFTKRIDSFKTAQEIELSLEQRKKELFAWRDHNPDNRSTSCEEILKYFEEYDKRTDYKVYGVPDSIHNLLKKNQLELGRLLCRKWSDNGDSDIFNAVKDQGPLLVLFVVGTATMAGYVSKSVTIDKTHIEDHGAWLYNGNTDTVHPVAHAERAFAVSGGYIKFGGPSLDDQYNVDYSFCSMGCAYNTFICDSDDVYVDWKAPSEYNSCACGYGVYSVKSLSV